MKKVTKQYGITADMAQERLEMWLEAERRVTTHQSYTIGGRSLTLANLAEIREEIDYWNGKATELAQQESSGGRNRIWRAVPRDW